MSTPLEQRISLATFICLLSALLCCVSTLYLTKSVYVPANSGFSENPVMCTTVSNTSLARCEDEGGNPSWRSCRDACMFMLIDDCTQIRVDVRRNGSNIRLEDCDAYTFDTKDCVGKDQRAKVYECVNGDCASMSGLFECTNGTCINVTSLLLCNYTGTSRPVLCNTRKACLYLEGYYECDLGQCARLRLPFTCIESCADIRTFQKDILIREGDVIRTANCGKARDIETETEIWPKDFRSISQSDRPPMLMMFCTTLVEWSWYNRSSGNVTLSDCINGTLLEPDHFGNRTNITHILTSHYESMDRLLDAEHRFAPPEQDLLIYNATPLYINHGGCVNTLEQECDKFYKEHGRDGTMSPVVKSQSRFQCYFDPRNSDSVLLRFSGVHSQQGLVLYAAIPVSLAIISCVAFVYRSKMMSAGDDLGGRFCFRCGGSGAKVVQKNAGESSAVKEENDK